MRPCGSHMGHNGISIYLLVHWTLDHDYIKFILLKANQTIYLLLHCDTYDQGVRNKVSVGSRT